MVNKQLRKNHRLVLKNIFGTNNLIFKCKFGMFCLYSIENSIVTLNHFELIRRFLLLRTKKLFKFWIFGQSMQNISAKNLGSRMGSGKGMHSHFVFKVRRGSLVFSFDKIQFIYFLKIIKKFKSILPFKFKIVCLKTY